MSYFNYHAKAKALINGGHLTGYEIVDNWNGIKPALVLHFDNNRSMPIREHRWDEYFLILSERKGNAKSTYQQKEVHDKRFSCMGNRKNECIRQVARRYGKSAWN